MNTRIFSTLVLVLGIALSACGQEQVPAATLTPLPTNTPNPSPTPSPAPTGTSTPVPVSIAYSPVPRWMILDQPFYSVEILGEIWNYRNDRWGETYACISYAREGSPPIEFEQCFALVYDETVSFEAQYDRFMADGFEELKPQNTFGGTGQVALLGKRLSENENEVIEYFEIVGIGDYVSLVELYIEIEASEPLQAVYEEHAAGIMDHALRDSLQKSRLIPRPTPTPLSRTQESLFSALGDQLITEPEANILYEGSWEALNDFVSSRSSQVCRRFEDRTNADVLWVRFSNCIYIYDDSTAAGFEDYVENIDRNIFVFLESRHRYDDATFFLGEQPGHTFFYAYLIRGEFLYLVSLESRTLGGLGIEDVFTESVDDFIYEVLMVNINR